MAIQGAVSLFVAQIDRLPSIQLAAPNWSASSNVDDWVALTGSSSNPVNKYKALYLGKSPNKITQAYTITSVTDQEMEEGPDLSKMPYT